MTLNGWIQILVFTLLVLALVKPLGGYMTRVFTGERTVLSPVLRPLERALYSLAGIDEHHEQHWLAYTIAMLVFHIAGFLILYAVLRLQAILPFNPQEMSAVPEDLAFNTASSFVTNTNWQNYGGESTLSYLAQMLGLTHQNFLSAATGHRAGRGPHPGFRPRVGQHRRQLLGRCHPLHPLRASAALHPVCPLSRLAGHPADAGALR